MKVLLIYPRSNDLLHNSSLPLGLISIGTYLKHAGHTVKIIDFDQTHLTIDKILKDFNPDICGVSVRSSKQVSAAIRISKKIKKYNIPVVWGGAFLAMPTLEHLFESQVIDIVSFSEGEATWVDLVNTLEKNGSLKTVKGIAFIDNGKIFRTEKREFIDLSKVLPCDWTLVDVPAYFQHLYGAKKLVYVYMSKGCPGNCAFCYNGDFHDSCVRRKSVDIFIEELEFLVKEYQIDGFYLADEFAFSRKSDLYELCDILDKKKFDLIWGFETRIGLLNPYDLQRAYDSGCCFIHFGIETASPHMIEKVKKNIQLDKVIPTFEACNKIGIIPVSTFIIGMPHETVEDLKATVDFIKKMPTNEISVMQYGYIHNSEFGREIYNSGKYNLPKTLKDYKKIDIYYGKMQNVSEIPKRDLYVVQGYFFWQLLTKKDYIKYPNEEKGLFVFKKHLEIITKRALYVDIVDLPETFLKSAVPFFRFFTSYFFNKKTRKKYNLD